MISSIYVQNNKKIINETCNFTNMNAINNISEFPQNDLRIYNFE